jgi:glycosyltransferase involved in cell wall biosynthesis
MLGSLAMSRASVVIPVFNAAATISGAIVSALEQRFEGHIEAGNQVEVIVVKRRLDRRQCGNFARICDRIRVTDQPNRGAASTRNADAAVAHSE